MHTKEILSASVVEQPPAPGFRMLSPTLQAILIAFAICLSVLRVLELKPLGLSLQGWGIPPECIVYCIILGLLAVQQFGWEHQLLQDYDQEEGGIL